MVFISQFAVFKIWRQKLGPIVDYRNYTIRLWEFRDWNIHMVSITRVECVVNILSCAMNRKSEKRKTRNLLLVYLEPPEKLFLPWIKICVVRRLLVFNLSNCALLLDEAPFHRSQFQIRLRPVFHCTAFPYPFFLACSWGSHFPNHDSHKPNNTISLIKQIYQNESYKEI